jgi:hypothetical protein
MNEIGDNVQPVIDAATAVQREAHRLLEGTKRWVEEMVLGA